jgi:hypothetical protein
LKKNCQGPFDPKQFKKWVVNLLSYESEKGRCVKAEGEYKSFSIVQFIHPNIIEEQQIWHRLLFFFLKKKAKKRKMIKIEHRKNKELVC